MHPRSVLLSLVLLLGALVAAAGARCRRIMFWDTFGTGVECENPTDTRLTCDVRNVASYRLHVRFNESCTVGQTVSLDGAATGAFVADGVTHALQAGRSAYTRITLSALTAVEHSGACEEGGFFVQFDVTQRGNHTCTVEELELTLKGLTDRVLSWSLRLTLYVSGGVLLLCFGLAALTGGR